MRKILILQLFILLPAAGLSEVVWSTEVALAFLFGAGIALSNSSLLAWRSRRLQRRRPADARGDLKAFYFSAIERLVIVMMLFVAGLGALELSPLPLLTGFILGQAVFLISSIKMGPTTHGE